MDHARMTSEQLRIEVVDDFHDGIGKGAPHQMGLNPLHQD